MSGKQNMSGILVQYPYSYLQGEVKNSSLMVGFMNHFHKFMSYKFNEKIISKEYKILIIASQEEDI
jgi:hypothetical protein